MANLAWILVAVVSDQWKKKQIHVGSVLRQGHLLSVSVTNNMGQINCLHLKILMTNPWLGIFTIISCMGSVGSCWIASQYRLCSLFSLLVPLLPLSSPPLTWERVRGTSVRFSSRLSTVIPFLWTTFHSGAMPPQWRSLEENDDTDYHIRSWVAAAC